MASKIEFSLNVYPSAGKPGQHAIAVTSSSDSSLVLGYTSDPEGTMKALSKIVASDLGWSHDGLNTHTLKVSTTQSVAAKAS